MEEIIRIAAFTGSLRRNSYNKATILAAKEMLPDNVYLDIIDLAEIPFYNEDVEAAGIPEAVASFKMKLAAADGFLIATPEYNYSIPPVLKNALDWASRGSNLPLSGKPLAIVSASPGIFGGARVQYHLRQVCVVLNLLPLNKPEVFIMNAKAKFDQNGLLTDAFSREALKNLLQALVDRIRDL